jgi:hypothetical protein
MLVFRSAFRTDEVLAVGADHYTLILQMDARIAVLAGSHWFLAASRWLAMNSRSGCSVISADSKISRMIDWRPTR